MIRQLRALVRRQDFFPGWLGVFLNPFYIARASLRDAMALQSSKLGGKLLDVGCGSKPYQELFTVDTYIGLEIDSEASRRFCLVIYRQYDVSRQRRTSGPAHSP